MHAGVKKILFHCYPLQYAVVFFLLLSFCNYRVIAQCPPNIDFEQGDFAGWQYYQSRIPIGGGKINWGFPVPVDPVRLKLINHNISDTDYYGGFPVMCPNGSNYALKLGNDGINNEADRITYTFTIPVNQNEFSIIYNYAVVFEDPGHLAGFQPRFTVEIFNITDNKTDTCSSFDFIVQGGLPGFLISPRSPFGVVPFVPIWYKDWASASVNLDGNAGKTFRLSFATTDCGYSAHFGYAYVDVNTGCKSSFINNVVCNKAPAIKLNAPFGYQQYTWYDSAFTKVLGTQQELDLKPVPPTGTKVAVSVTPYSGYGCVDTFYTRIYDTLKVVAAAGKDASSCNDYAIQLGSMPEIGLQYSWSPVAGLSNPFISNPVANPDKTTAYILTVTDKTGFCESKDTVTIERPCKNFIYVPSGFTPNGDGNNDRLRPVIKGFAKLNYFHVYNRWGQLLFSLTNDPAGWDGKVNGKPEVMQTVVWVLEGVDADGKFFKQQGTTVLIR